MFKFSRKQNTVEPNMTSYRCILKTMWRYLVYGLHSLIFESFHETGMIWVPLTFSSVFYLLGHQNLFLKVFCINYFTCLRICNIIIHHIFYNTVYNFFDAGVGYCGGLDQCNEFKGFKNPEELPCTIYLNLLKESSHDRFKMNKWKWLKIILYNCNYNKDKHYPVSVTENNIYFWYK